MGCGAARDLVVVGDEKTEFGYIVDPTKNINCSAGVARTSSASSSIVLTFRKNNARFRQFPSTYHPVTISVLSHTSHLTNNN